MLVGLQLYEGSAEAMRRQELAVRSLAKLTGVEIVNVQFEHAPWATLPGVEMRTALKTNSIAVAGPGGRPKPMTRELFDVIWSTAVERGHEYFAYINSDILVLPSTVDAVARLRRQTYAISRHDVEHAADPPAPDAVVTSGIDMFVVCVEWWRRNRQRFRPYVVGDTCWDNVYAAVMMCHSDGVLLNRDPMILHERHASVWNDATATARYNGFAAALDARYFSLWCQYWERLTALRAAGASEAQESSLRDEMFVWRPSPVEAVKQSLRSVRARIRYWSIRRAFTAQANLATLPRRTGQSRG